MRPEVVSARGGQRQAAGRLRPARSAGRDSPHQDGSAQPGPAFYQDRLWWVAPILVALGAAWFLGRQQLLTGELWGVPVDDTYIHFRFAENLAAGAGFSFNPGQAVPGSTSPLWVLLLAVAARCGVPLWLAAKVAGVACLAGASVLAGRLGRMLAGPLVGVLAGVLTAIDGRLLWAAPSGMEVTLFAALCLAAFTVAATPTSRQERRVLVVAGLCGLATLTRPEGYLCTAVVATCLVWGRGLRPTVLAAAGALYAAVTAPWVLFCLATTGRPLPTTYYAKAAYLGDGTAAVGERALHYAGHLLALLAAANPVILLCAPLGAIALWRSGRWGRAVVVWPALLVAEQALLSPYLYHFGRYVMPLQPFFVVWAAAGAAGLASRLPGRPFLRLIVAAAPLALGGLATLGAWADRYAGATANVDAMQVAIGSWARVHTPPGAALAMNDIGAISFVSGRPAVDIVGLVSPRYIGLGAGQPPARRASTLLAQARRDGARYLIIFPAVYPDLAAQPGLRRLMSVTVQPNVIEAAPTMVIYALSP